MKNFENKTPFERIEEDMYKKKYIRNPSERITTAMSEADDNSSEAEEYENCVKLFPYAMVYAPMQEWRELYDPEEGLCVGTIFKELDFPFYPASGKGGNCK